MAKITEAMIVVGAAFYDEKGANVRVLAISEGYAMVRKP